MDQGKRLGHDNSSSVHLAAANRLRLWWVFGPQRCCALPGNSSTIPPVAHPHVQHRRRNSGERGIWRYAFALRSVLLENGTSFCPDEIFELYPESQREINAKPEPGGYKWNVNKEKPHIIGTHPKFVRKSGRNMETIFFKKIFEPNNEWHFQKFNSHKFK